MDPLPSETWTQIVEDHLGSPEWLALSLTSTFFRPMAQASLYRRVFIKTSRHSHAFNRGNMSLVQFSRTMEERAELRGYVRILTIETSEPRGGDYAKNRLVFTAAVFPQLRTLRLRRFHIEDTFFSTLRTRYPRLTSVEFGNCFIAINPSDAPIHPDSNSHFRGLSNNCRDVFVRATHCVMSTPLAFGDIGTYSGTRGNSEPQYETTPVQNLDAWGGINALTRLIINYNLCTSSSMILFLTSAPHIRVLSLGVWEANSYYTAQLTSLPSHAVPLLEDFSGPAEFSQIFVPGRPVHTVDLCFSLASPADVLLSLRYSTASIVKLAVFAWRPSIRYEALLQHAPISVRDLTLHVPYEKIVLSMIPSLSRLKYLQMVKVGVEGRGGAEEVRAGNAQIVQKLSNACSSIRAFTFVGERWLALREGIWEHYIGSEEPDDLWGSTY